MVRLCGGSPGSVDDVVVDWSESSRGIHAINGVGEWALITSVAVVSKPMLALNESAGHCGVQEAKVVNVLLCVHQPATVWVPVDMGWVPRSWHLSPGLFLGVGLCFLMRGVQIGWSG